MDEDRIGGAAQNLAGKAKDAAGGALGDTKLQAEGKVDKAAGTVRNAAGGVKDAARDLGDDARGEVDRLMRESVTPALAGVAGTAEDYARQAKDAIVERSELLSETVKERPLLAVGLGLATGYLIGRLMGGNTYIYPRH